MFGRGMLSIACAGLLIVAACSDSVAPEASTGHEEVLHVEDATNLTAILTSRQMTLRTLAQLDYAERNRLMGPSVIQSERTRLQQALVITTKLLDSRFAAPGMIQPMSSEEFCDIENSSSGISNWGGGSISHWMSTSLEPGCQGILIHESSLTVQNGGSWYSIKSTSPSKVNSYFTNHDGECEITGQGISGAGIHKYDKPWPFNDQQRLSSAAGTCQVDPQ